MGNPFSHLDDKKLMELYQADESQAFQVLYERHQSKVYTYLYKRLSDTNSINDIFQNTFLKFHKVRFKYDPKYEVLQWIYTITRNEFLDYVKKKKVETTELQEELLILEEESSEKIDINLENASLSSNEKKAIDLRYFSDNEFEEISILLNTSSSNVRKIISRGIGKLRKKYLAGDSNE
ncbi:RNA polymerase sigma factor [Halobacteriovorax sp. HLS]|uniref:RNA polymerase sigma factor n=1 Tax=Halobacteriovorax sp. HLS TaxID=2234000 RepID=UPI000FDB8C69|nr:sigma-70 family RNA polymerase sigma factor [Halobacteriovorax sp. HLS]